eukprot:scaffold98044_cov72-Phaeocystis_antarctica.AAC.5
MSDGSPSGPRPVGRTVVRLSPFTSNKLESGAVSQRVHTCVGSTGAALWSVLGSHIADFSYFSPDRETRRPRLESTRIPTQDALKLDKPVPHCIRVYAKMRAVPQAFTLAMLVIMPHVGAPRVHASIRQSIRGVESIPIEHLVGHSVALPRCLPSFVAAQGQAALATSVTARRQSRPSAAVHERPGRFIKQAAAEWVVLGGNGPPHYGMPRHTPVTRDASHGGVKAHQIGPIRCQTEGARATSPGQAVVSCVKVPHVAHGVIDEERGAILFENVVCHPIGRHGCLCSFAWRPVVPHAETEQVQPPRPYHTGEVSG